MDTDVGLSQQPKMISDTRQPRTATGVIFVHLHVKGALETCDVERQQPRGHGGQVGGSGPLSIPSQFC